MPVASIKVRRQPPACGAINVTTPQQVLSETFGYDAFRGQQQAIIDTLVVGDDALVLMPTGGGKSLCYQIPALLRDGVGIIVSPLIALMADQVAALGQLGVQAAYLNSSLDAGEQRAVEQAMRTNTLDLVYMAPERLMQPATLDFLQQCKIALIAIDEAHCVSQWGHDFRPEYMQLSALADQFPEVPRIALTATADLPTRNEIAERLQLGQARHFTHSFDRPNICYRVAEQASGKQQLLRFIRDEHPGEAGIVYCLSRRKTDAIAEWLNEQGVAALAYHAGLGHEARSQAQQRFLREDGLVVVATVAFGMGIDKPDVRFVAHLDLPASIESYYQETGRAGRDGAPADAWMLYGLGDVVQRRRMIEDGQASAARKQVEQHKLNAMLAYCELASCRRINLLGYFGETLEQPCGNCDTCLSPPATWDATRAAQMALSAVYRTGQRFGVAYLIEHLRGEASERAVNFGHDRLTTFGVGEELSPKQWRSLLRQLVARGFLAVDVGGYGGLHLTAEARPLLRGEMPLSLREDRKPARTRKTAKTAKAAKAADTPLDEAARALFEALRALRKRLADEQSVPPYVIFHDSTLAAMAEAAPADRAAMMAINGIGEKKLQAYGETFLAEIAAHRQASSAS